MTVTLELPPEVEQRLAAQAAARGVSTEDYILSLIEGAALPAMPPDTNLDQFEADLDALSAGSENLPVLPPAAFSRESIYADHD